MSQDAKNMVGTEEEIKRLIREMNDAWLSGRIEELDRFFDPAVVIAVHGSDHRIIGRDAVVDSFREYTAQAVTHRFEELVLQVDAMGTTAVAVLRFHVVYEIDGATYEETAREIFVLALSEEAWRIVWRMQVGEE